MRYFGIRKGRKVGVVIGWDEAEKLVKGFAGAIYKGFATEEEAKKFVNGTPILSYSGAVKKDMRMVQWGEMKGRKSLFVDVSGVMNKFMWASCHEELSAVFGKCLCVRYLDCGVYEVRLMDDERMKEVLEAGSVVLNGRNVIVCSENPLGIKSAVVKIAGYSFDMELEVLEKELKKRTKLLGKIFCGTKIMNGVQCLTGDLYAKVKIDDEISLTEQMEIVDGEMKCQVKLFCKELFVKCYNCLEKGHVAKECTNDVRCVRCKKSGHIAKVCDEGNVNITESTAESVTDGDVPVVEKVSKSNVNSNVAKIVAESTAESVIDGTVPVVEKVVIEPVIEKTVITNSDADANISLARPQSMDARKTNDSDADARDIDLDTEMNDEEAARYRSPLVIQKNV